MALIDDLLNDIANANLRARLRTQIEALRKEKKFGLVFEQHLPEMLCLYDAKFYRGARVTRRNGSIGPLYIIEKLQKSKAICRPEAGGDPVEFPLSNLAVVKRFGEPVFPTVTLVDAVHTAGDAPHHVLIEADNYHALQLLEWMYCGRVDCIYIDPPYNSGARDWKYNNDYVDRADTWRHSKWLAFMKRRLTIARRLLKPDGVLIVTIDEHELHHLGMLLEDVMRGFQIQMVTIVINPKGTGKINFARVEEHAIFCLPDLGVSTITGAPTAAGRLADVSESNEDEDDVDDEDNDDNDIEEIVGEDTSAARPPFPPEEADLWELRHARRRGGESSYRHQRWRSFYPLWIDAEQGRVVSAGESLPLDQEPNFSVRDGLTPIWPIDAEGNHRCWRLVPTSMQQLIDAGRVVLGRYNAAQNTWTVNLWVRKASTRKLKTVWWEASHDAGTHGTTLLNRILGRRDAFPFPKSVYAVRDAIAAVVRNRPNALVLDFFAGSGTTFHAVAMLNAVDGGNRQCILVTNNEVADRRAEALRKAGILPGTDDWEREGICQAVTWPRCKAVITGVREDGTPLDGEWNTGKLAPLEVPRTVRALSYTTPELLQVVKNRRALASTLGIRVDALAKANGWYIAPPKARDAVPDQAVLLNPAEIENFAAALARDGSHIRLISLVMPEDAAFKRHRQRILDALGPFIELKEVTAPMANGLPANLNYVRLNFIDPNALEMGAQFSDLLPSLWMMAGCRGPIPTATGEEPFIIPDKAGFAVLLRQSYFRSFCKRLQKASDIDWVFIVTDSRDAFIELSDQLPSRVPRQQRVHLYRNYLENFQINRETEG